MKRLIGLLLALGVAAMMISAVVSSAAQAAIGPLWIVEAGGKMLGASEKRVITGKNESVTFKLKGSETIECTGVKVSGELLGGEPGSNKEKIIFTGCVLEKHKLCFATGSGKAEGEVEVNALSVLAYNEGEPETSMALVAFAPETGSVFAEFTLKGGTTNCTTFSGLGIKVEAKGTALTDPVSGESRKCGVLAQVGKINGGAFELTSSGTVAEVGGTNLPTTAIKKAELLEGGAFKTIECKLEAGALGVAVEIGVASVETNPKEPFGWAI